MTKEAHFTEAYGVDCNTVQFNGELQHPVKNLPVGGVIVLNFSDGTLLHLRRGSNPGGVTWRIDTKIAGRLLIAVDGYTEGAFSDIAFFGKGLTRVTVSTVYATVSKVTLHERV